MSKPSGSGALTYFAGRLEALEELACGMSLIVHEAAEPLMEDHAHIGSGLIGINRALHHAVGELVADAKKMQKDPTWNPAVSSEPATEQG